MSNVPIARVKLPLRVSAIPLNRFVYSQLCALPFIENLSRTMELLPFEGGL